MYHNNLNLHFCIHTSISCYICENLIIEFIQQNFFFLKGLYCSTKHNSSLHHANKSYENKKIVEYWQTCLRTLAIIMSSIRGTYMSRSSLAPMYCTMGCTAGYSCSGWKSTSRNLYKLCSSWVAYCRAPCLTWVQKWSTHISKINNSKYFCLP